jgi:parallel beta-helix repeat protein
MAYVTDTDLAATGAGQGANMVGIIRSDMGAIPRTVAADGSDDVVKSTQFTTLQQAANAAAGKTLRIIGTNTITSTISLADNTLVVGDRGAVVQTATPDISLFTVIGKTGVVIDGVRLKQITAGFDGYVGGVLLQNSTSCTVRNCDFEGMQWAGVYLAYSNYNTILSNRFHNFLGDVENSADVQVYYDSSYNTIIDNDCYGGKDVGINIQDPAGAGEYFPHRNRVINNRIGTHSKYGVNVYIGGKEVFLTGSISGTTLTVTSITPVQGMTNKVVLGQTVIGMDVLPDTIVTSQLSGTPGGAGTYTVSRSQSVNSASLNCRVLRNSYNLIEGNFIEDISSTLTSFTGSGIYAVGNGIGGLIISNNQIRNCCTQTPKRVNAPAGIGISNVQVGVVPPSVIGNKIADMPQGDGILVATCPGGVSVVANAITMPASNNGTGPGGGELLGAGIRFDNSSNCIASSNTVHQYGVGAGILSFATAMNQTNNVLSGNIVYVANNNGIRVIRDSSRTNSQFNIANNVVSCGGANVCYEFSGLNGATIVGNGGSTGAREAMNAAACTRTRVGGNVFTSTGTYGVVLSGTSTGSLYDRTNIQTGLFSNQSTGFQIELEVTGIPTAGNFKVGDRAVNVAASVGQPKAWRNTVAGSPGTFATEGNLG